MKKQNPEIRFLEDCLLIDRKILVISDFHIGYEEEIGGEGLVFRIQLREAIKKLERIFAILEKEKTRIKKIIVLGDLKHEFGRISDAEWRETLQLLDYLADKVGGEAKNKIILVRGNHDNIVGPIAKKREIKIKDCYKTKKVCFLHGDKFYSCCSNSETLIIGHLHPAIVLENGHKREKYKCFLEGRWRKKQVYILPSFIPISLGYDLKTFRGFSGNKKNFSIINHKSLEKFKVIIYNNKEDKEYNFGELKKFL